MNKKLRILKWMTVAAGCLAIPPAFGQATYTWTGGNGTGVEIGAATNWGGTLPNTATEDTAMWDGSVPGPLNLIYNMNTLQSGFGQSGIHLYLAGTQTSPVSIQTTLSPNSAPIAIYNITIEPGAGAFSFGGLSAANRLEWIGRPTAAFHSLINNSTNPATINPWIRYTAGGGAAWTLGFSGEGDWIANSYMVNDNGAGMLIQLDGPGRLIWTPTGFLGANGIDSPVNINGGTLILKGSHPRLGNQTISLNGTFVFDAAGDAETLSGVISGGGSLVVSNGTLTLSGQSSYFGDTVLAGGELVVGGAENPGVSGPLGAFGTIRFAGGALKYSVNNTYDYSARFSTDAGQKYTIDTAGQNVSFVDEAGLTSSGGTLTKLGAGTLTLAGPSTYSGATTVSAGKLVFQGTKSGNGTISVADNAAVAVFATGSQVTPSTLTLGTVVGAILEFESISSTTVAPLAAGTITAAGTVTINVNSGSMSPGNSYPLLSWTSGSAPAVTLGILNGFIGNLTTNGNSIRLNVTESAYRWTGNNNGSWDTTTANNWQRDGSPVLFANGGSAVFDDTVTGTTDVTVSGTVLPATVTFNNGNSSYTLATSVGSGIGGTATVTKTGNGTVVLNGGGSTYTGATIINNGTLSVSSLNNGGVASDIGSASSSAANLSLNGGTLQYTGGGATSDRSFTLGLSGGIVDGSGAGNLHLSATSLGYSGNGPRTLTLSGTAASNSLAANIVDNGGATALTKNGSGTWVLTGTNTYSGLTTIANGVLQVGAGGASGTIGTGSIVNNARLVFNRTGTVTVGSAISGSGAVTNAGPGTLVLTGNNTYSGGTTISAGTVQVGDGGATGSLHDNSGIVNNGLLVFNSTSPITLNQFFSVVSGTGNIWVRSTGLVKVSAANTYTGWVLIDPGATFQPFEGNQGQFVGSVITNNGTLFLTGQEAPATRGFTNNIVGTGRVLKENNNQNEGWIIFAGNNTYSGGTFLAGGGISLGDGVTPGVGSIVGPVVFTNTATQFKNPRRLVFNRPDDYVFTNTVISVVTDGSAVQDQGALRHMGPGVLTLAGNISYPGTTTIDPGMTLIVGTGGTSGSIGTGEVVNDGFFVVNKSSDTTIPGTISGSGSLVKMGTGILTLGGNGTYFGETTVSNGTLFINNNHAASQVLVYGGTLGGTGTISGPVTTEVGTKLAAGASPTSIGTLTFNNFLSINGDVAVKVNRSLAQSNDVFVVNGGVFKTGGGTLTVANLGPDLVVGDKFYLFSQPVSGAAAFTITGGDATWQNNLEVDGSITATSVTPSINKNPPVVQVSVSGNVLSLAWPTNRGWTLQTNSVGIAASSQWFPYPGSETITNVNFTVDPTRTNVFFRMVYTNTP